MEIMEFCKEVAGKIHTYEANAKKALADNDTEKYTELMRAKASLLASLSTEMASKSMQEVAPKAQGFVMQKLASFSQSAQTAISLNSVWYMSQLLFDTDYEDGAPNNFDLFIEEVESFK